MRHKNYGTVETKRASCHKGKTQANDKLRSVVFHVADVAPL